MNQILLSLQISTSQDILIARQKSRQIAQALGFDDHDQIRIAAAISEFVRDFIKCTDKGKIQFILQNDARQELLVTFSSSNNRDFDEFVNNLKNPETSNSGIMNARRLMDRFEVQTSPDGSTEAVLAKSIHHRLSKKRLESSIPQLNKTTPVEYGVELERLNQELIKSIEALKRRQDELHDVNQELEETNRGVVALYAELDEKAEHLRRADQVKSKFLSHMSHEFRTPLNSIMGLAHLLLDRTSGDLTPEQEKQVRFISTAAQGLTEMVNDLLDIAKIEAGKTEVNSEKFEVSELFGTLRGMFRPLQTNPEVTLQFADVSHLPPMESDEGKISQILRNYISNALKFTETGRIDVSAKLDESGNFLVLSVTDTGIGIPRERQSDLFVEFSQLITPFQKKIKGTGLGLALSRKLAELLGGRVWVVSAPGEGSSFFAKIPVKYGFLANVASQDTTKPDLESVLIVDDDEVWRYLMRGWLFETGRACFEATNALEGLRMAEQKRPALIILDLNMPEISGFDFLIQKEQNPLISDIPVMINTSKILEIEEKKFLRAHSDEILSKEGLSREEVMRRISDIFKKRVGSAR